ncbi:hypothetical protein ABBQ32_006217 [Trebouxia sp. C0010 RCD-2024]
MHLRRLSEAARAARAGRALYGTAVATSSHSSSKGPLQAVTDRQELALQDTSLRMAQALLVAQARLDLLQRQLDAALTASTAPMTSRKSAMKNRSCHFAKQRMWSTSWQQQLLLQVGRLVLGRLGQVQSTSGDYLKATKGKLLN